MANCANAPVVDVSVLASIFRMLVQIRNSNTTALPDLATHLLYILIPTALHGST